MNELKFELSKHYRKGFFTSETIENDIKLIKKLNMLFGKLEKSEKEIYVQEIINVIKILNNVIKIENILVIIYNNVDIRYHDLLNHIVNRVIAE